MFEVRRELAKGPFRMFAHGSVEYKSENGKPVPTRITYSTRGVPDIGTTRWEYDITKYSSEAIAADEFTLSYFGLGEMDRTLEQVTASGKLWKSAVASAVFVGSIASLIIARRVRRGRTGREPART